jgi:hypothetical protein
MVNARWILFSLIVIFCGASASNIAADDRASEAAPASEIPVMTIASIKNLGPDISLPLISKNDWRFLLTLSHTSDAYQLTGKGIYPRFPAALALNFNDASDSILHGVSVGADVDFRIHQHARVRMTYIRLNAHDNYIDAFRQYFSANLKNVEKRSECAVVQLRIQF